MKRLSFALTVVAWVSLASNPASASNGYTVDALPTTADGPFYAHEVMPNGFVVGTGGPGARAVVWTVSGGVQEMSYVDPNTMMDTPLAGLGVPVGLSSDLRRVALGMSKWVWDQGQLVEIPFLEMGANFSPQVNAMNLDGMVVGEGNVPWAATTAYVWDGEQATILGPMDQESAAKAISSSGIPVGWVRDAMGNQIPHKFAGGGGAGSLGVPDGYTNGEAVAVNDAGDAVGRVWNANEDAGWAYIGGEHHVFTQLDCVLAINAAGQMLGQQGSACALAWGQPPSFSTDGGDSWAPVGTLLEGETPYAPGDDLQGVGIDDAGRIVVNVRTPNFDEGVLILTPEGSGDLNLRVDAPAAVQGGPAFDYDAVLENMGMTGVESYALTITFSGDAKLGEGVIPSGCTATKDADQWVSQIDCADLGMVDAWSEDLRRFSMVPSQLGVVTANFVATAELADGTQEVLVTAVDTTVSDDAADLRVKGTAKWILDQERYIFEITVTNDGPDTAHNPRVELQFTDAKISDLGFDENFGRDCTRPEDGLARCALEDLAVGESWTAELTPIADVKGGEFSYEMTVESDTPDPDLANNTDEGTLVENGPTSGCGGSDCSTTGSRGSLWTGLLVLLAWRRRRR